MKLKFKVQPYQTEAVDAVIDCFDGQPRRKGVRYTIDPGEITGVRQTELDLEGRSDSGLRNHEIAIPRAKLLDRISIALDEAQEKQARLTTKVAKRLAEDAVALADACDGPEVDRLDDTLPIPELVAAIREQGIRIEGWDRDGFVVTPGEAYAYATMRSIDPYQDPGYVTVDLLDGEVEVRIP